MKDLDEEDKMLEKTFGVISGFYLFSLHELSTAAGSTWDFNDPTTMDIIVTKGNADLIYGLCKEIRSGYNIGLNKKQYSLIKEARMQAHKLLWEEANDPDTSIKRKIELVKLTAKIK